MSPALEWVGLGDFQSVLKRIPDQLDRATRDGVREAAMLLKTHARANAPVGGDRDKRPGKLQRSIGYSTPKRVGSRAWQAQVRPRAKHSWRIETGEPKHNPDRAGRTYSRGTAHRFMARAHASAKTEFPAIITRQWSRVLRG